MSKSINLISAAYQQITLPDVAPLHPITHRISKVIQDYFPKYTSPDFTLKLTCQVVVIIDKNNNQMQSAATPGDRNIEAIIREIKAAAQRHLPSSPSSASAISSPSNSLHSAIQDHIPPSSPQNIPLLPADQRAEIEQLKQALSTLRKQHDDTCEAFKKHIKESTQHIDQLKLNNTRLFEISEQLPKEHEEKIRQLTEMHENLQKMADENLRNLQEEIATKAHQISFLQEDNKSLKQMSDKRISNQLDNWDPPLSPLIHEADEDMLASLSIRRELKEEIDHLNNIVQNATTLHINSLEGENQQLQTENDHLQTEIAQLSQAYINVSTELTTMQDTIQAQEKTIANLRTENQTLKTSLPSPKKPSSHHRTFSTSSQRSLTSPKNQVSISPKKSKEWKNPLSS